MDWQQVADLKKPKKYAILRDNPEARSDRIPEMKFVPDQFGTAMQGGSHAAGFIFYYRFDTDNQYDVFFDGQGKVAMVEKPRTVKDLFNGNL